MQSVRYKTHVKPTPQMKVAEVVEAAKRAKVRASVRPFRLPRGVVDPLIPLVGGVAGSDFVI